MSQDNGQMSEAKEITTLVEIGRMLAQTYTEAEGTLWLNSPHPQLSGEKATNLIANGRADEVLAALRRMDDCAYV